MKGAQAMEIFKAARGSLPTKIEDLVPLSFIGQAAVEYYRTKIKTMKALNVAESQRKATLADGQDAGEMLLDIEMRIGEIAAKEKPARAVQHDHRGNLQGAIPTGKPPKHERLGIPSQKRMQQAQRLAKNKPLVERHKKAARQNEDIPTRTGALSEIKRDKLVKDHKGFDPTKKYTMPDINRYITQTLKHINESIKRLGHLKGNIKHADSLSKESLRDTLDRAIALYQEVRKETEI